MLIGNHGRFAAMFAISTLGVLLMGVPTASANVFVFQLLPPHYDDVPTIELSGPNGTAPAVLDTGGGGEMVVEGGTAIGNLGLDPSTGTPTSIGGVGPGSTPATAGVTVPPSVAPTGTITPPGQMDGNPDLPDQTLTVGAGDNSATIGSVWLNNFHFGRVQGEPHDYFYLADKEMGRQGHSDAVSIANFFASPDHFGTRQEDDVTKRKPARRLPPPQDDIRIPRPSNSISEVITPVPPRTLPPGVVAGDGGFHLGVDIVGGNADVAVFADVPFILKTGIEFSLISLELAEKLGLAVDNLPTAPIITPLGVITVPITVLKLQLFNDNSFPPLSVTVGIGDKTVNPFQDNFIGGNVFILFSYWDISSTEPDGLTRFWAALRPGLRQALDLESM